MNPLSLSKKNKKWKINKQNVNFPDEFYVKQLNAIHFYSIWKNTSSVDFISGWQTSYSAVSVHSRVSSADVCNILNTKNLKIQITSDENQSE